jgi:hypothetical protein
MKTPNVAGSVGYILYLYLPLFAAGLIILPILWLLPFLR